MFSLIVTMFSTVLNNYILQFIQMLNNFVKIVSKLSAADLLYAAGKGFNIFTTPVQMWLRSQWNPSEIHISVFFSNPSEFHWDLSEISLKNKEIPVKSPSIRQTWFHWDFTGISLKSGCGSMWVFLVKSQWNIDLKTFINYDFTEIWMDPNENSI